MKLTDINQIHEAGLISQEQRQQIIDHFRLEHPRNRFLTIMVTLGGLLVLSGIILVISANWAEIPGLVKIATGAFLMCAAHFAGWKLRRASESESPSKLSEVFHFIGAGMFLANIALVGQVYHLSSRSPNALILWLIGIIPLAWILRSKSIHVLSLAGAIVWLGFEINARDGWFYFGHYETSQFAVYSSVGMLLYGSGLLLRRTSFNLFALSTELFGVLMLHFGLWPLVLVPGVSSAGYMLVLMAIPATVGLLLAVSELRRDTGLTSQWRYSWLAVLAGWLVLGATSMLTGADRYSYAFGGMNTAEAFAAILLVAGSFVQIRVAEELRASWMVNVAIITIAFATLATFFRLIGSMMNTGIIFLVGGIGILALGFLLETKRRAILKRIHA